MMTDTKRIAVCSTSYCVGKWGGYGVASILDVPVDYAGVVRCWRNTDTAPDGVTVVDHSGVRYAGLMFDSQLSWWLVDHGIEYPYPTGFVFGKDHG